MIYRVVIPSGKNNTFPLKGLNELLGGRMYDFRTKKYRNPVKTANDRVCCVCIKRDLKGVKLKTPIKCTYHIYAPDKRHDKNNLESATSKSFLDALQQCGCIKSDGFDYVDDSVFRTVVDKNFPRIEVLIEELANGD